MNKTLIGAGLGTATGLAWGGQFVVGKSAVAHVDAFHLTAVRYALAGLLLLAILAAVEGRAALRLDGRGLRLWWLGTLGFAGFNLLGFTGLEHARAQSASLIVALAPLLTALVLWQRSGVRPRRSTLLALAVALVGVALVISGGDPASIVHGSIGWGDALVLGGVFSFILYTLGATEFPGLSPLRYTALTAALGWLSIAGATAIASATALEPEPSLGGYTAIWPQILYIALIGAVVAVVSWNGSVVLLGPQNATLFGNLIPVTTFVIEIVRGYRPGALELAGAALTIGALVANNLLTRRSEVSRVEADDAALEWEPAKAA
ncbi:MAG TPA: DMT family transporter [Gaiellaceae bacterium]|nr:DMT family transporter [Gaiellaceae bacterium]